MVHNGEQARSPEIELAESMAWASYPERHTLWMHDQGRIGLLTTDVLGLAAEIERKEEAARAAVPDASSSETNSEEQTFVSCRASVVHSEPDNSTGVHTHPWVDTAFVTEGLFRKHPTSDPVRGKDKAWGKKEHALFIDQNVLHAVDLWDGDSDHAWDVQLREFTDARELGTVVTISRLEYVRSLKYTGPIPRSGHDYYRVMYTLTNERCTASKQAVAVDVKSQTWYRKASKTRLTLLSGTNGCYDVTPEQLRDVLDEIAVLTPREGRVWPDTSAP